MLNYAGQSAIALEGASTADNNFYRLLPEPLPLPLVVLASVATIIASQSIVTRAFSVTRRAIQLGWLPRLWITRTSDKGYGQISVADDIGLAVHRHFDAPLISSEYESRDHPAVIR